MTQTLRHKKLGKNLLKYATKKEARIQSGYSKSYASSGQILKTKGYKKTAKPILERYRKELQAILDAMELKDKNTEEYSILVSAADKIQKQIQLLTGGETERVGVIPFGNLDDLHKNNSVSKNSKAEKED